MTHKQIYGVFFWPVSKDVTCFMSTLFDLNFAETNIYLDSKVHGANMGPTCVPSAPDGPHVGPMNLAIRVYSLAMQVWCLMLYQTDTSPVYFS